LDWAGDSHYSLTVILGHIMLISDSHWALLDTGDPLTFADGTPCDVPELVAERGGFKVGLPAAHVC
jgi:hypothetical protein